MQNFGRIAFEKTNLCKTYAKMLNIKERKGGGKNRGIFEEDRTKDDYWNLIWVSTIVFCGNPVEIHENRPDTKKDAESKKLFLFNVSLHFFCFIDCINRTSQIRFKQWMILGNQTESISNIKLFLWTESSSIPIRIKSEDTPKTWQSFWSVDKDIPF